MKRNDPKEGILMSDKNNNAMMNNDMNNNMNNDNDPKERMRKKVKNRSRIFKVKCRNFVRFIVRFLHFLKKHRLLLYP